MKKIINALLFAFFLGTFVISGLRAQSSYTAASCNQSDVNAVINGPTHTAVDGDTINIPSGSCTWTSGITVPSGIGISIVGSGTPNTGPATTGAGASTTVLTDNISSGSLFSMNPIYGNSLSRLSLMQLLPYSPTGSYSAPVSVNGTCTSSGCPNLRLDNLTAPTSWNGALPNDDSFAFVSNVFGVADHNTVGDVAPAISYVNFVNLGNGSWQGTGGWGDNSWASADTFGTAQAFYLENNTFNYALATDTDIGGSNGGGARFVCRFNNFAAININGACSGHGTDTTGRARGVRQWEAYDNTGVCNNSSQGCGSAWPGRSGVGMSFGNSFTNSGGGFMKALAGLDSQRSWRAGYWGGCDGQSAWDTDGGTVYYTGTLSSYSGLGTGVWTITDSATPGWTTNQWAPSGAPYAFYDVTQSYGLVLSASGSNSLTTEYMCDGCISFRPASGDTYEIRRATVCMDQPARGAGVLVTGNTPVLQSTGNPGPVSEVLDPTYQAADSVPATVGAYIYANELTMIPNRDFYVESVNQPAQTSPASPFNGTSGTGHGALANRPTTCTTGVGYWATDQGSWNTSGSGGQGELFVCTATDTWTLYYTPYVYPHPLVVAPAPPAAPTNVKAVAH